MLDDPELIDEFLEEAREHLTQVEATLGTVLERDAAGRTEAGHVLFRAMHSLKGAAALLGAESLRELAHAAETVLAAIATCPGCAPPRSGEVRTSLPNARLRCRTRAAWGRAC